MQIKYGNIILRDMIESDIEDYVRWFTVKREWETWDAPWEKENVDEETERTSWRKYSDVNISRSDIIPKAIIPITMSALSPSTIMPSPYIMIKKEVDVTEIRCIHSIWTNPPVFFP